MAGVIPGTDVDQIRISDIEGLDTLLDDIVAELPYCDDSAMSYGKSGSEDGARENSSSQHNSLISPRVVAIPDATKEPRKPTAETAEKPKRKRGRPKGSKNGSGRKKKSKSPAKPVLSAEEIAAQRVERQLRRRERKNDRERGRREAMNSLYDKLETVMSELSKGDGERDDSKVDRGELLASAFKRIMDMRSELEGLDKADDAED